MTTGPAFPVGAVGATSDTAGGLQCLLGRLREAYPAIRGIVLFGSAARGETYEDLDLLVVVGEAVRDAERTEVLKALRSAL